MSGNTLVKSLTDWISAPLNPQEHPTREHCLAIRPHFRIPGVGTVDLLTARHEKGGPDHFRVDLWNILPRPIGESDLDPMLHGLHAFQAWYGDLVEQAETRGFSPDHCLNLRGNLVGTSLRGGRLLELLSHSGSCLCFWTWKRIPGGFDVVPAYGRTPALRATRNRLKRLLNHLSWRDVDERDERTAAVRL